ncbi:GTP pyrophosphokinase [Kribbella qitaiheensis]|uniref:GTP pyrophosphokinase n=1 Tax=Kribbella qitaiheensis TaxID=1544730 RepID=UPI001FEA89AC|nr:hypothetical protein [Kribbella qitaiheensis]
MGGLEVREWTVRAAAQYERTYQQYVGGARKLEALINELIGEEEGINYLSATARAKDPESFLLKASKPHPDDPTKPKYDDPLDQITDLVAARIITFLVEAVDRVCEVIESEFEIVEHTDMGAHTRAQGAFGYASKHYLVRLNAHRRELPEYAVLKNLTMEIQVRTAVQHAWAEFEHDIRYKLDIPPDRKPEFDRRFLLAGRVDGARGQRVRRDRQAVPRTGRRRARRGADGSDDADADDVFDQAVSGCAAREDEPLRVDPGDPGQPRGDDGGAADRVAPRDRQCGGAGGDDASVPGGDCAEAGR